MDNKQLNPVGETTSPIWLKDYKTFELTEIVRQGTGNPIIDLSRDIDMVYFKRPMIIDGKGYKFSNDINQIIEDLSQVNGTDELKYLSWTNNDVDSINKYVRENIYGNPDKIEKGETLVFNAPYGTFYTNKEEKVEELDIITDYVIVPTMETKINQGMLMGKMDKIKLRYYRINNSFNIIHEESDFVYKAITKNLKENCTKLGWNWRLFYYFAEQFADIKYNHALSVHKSLRKLALTKLI